MSTETMRQMLIDLFSAKLGSGPAFIDQQDDVAILLNFPNIVPAIIPQDGYARFFKKRDTPGPLILRKNRRRELMERIIEQISGMLKEVAGPDDYLMVIVYGITTPKNRTDIFISIDQGQIAAGRLKVYRCFQRKNNPTA